MENNKDPSLILEAIRLAEKASMQAEAAHRRIDESNKNLKEVIDDLKSSLKDFQLSMETVKEYINQQKGAEKAHAVIIGVGATIGGALASGIVSLLIK